MKASTSAEAVQAEMPERSGREARFKSLARRQTSLVTPFALFAVLLVISAVRGASLFTANGLDGALIGAAPLVLGTLAITTIAIAGPAGVDLSIGPAMTLINIEIVIELPKVGITGPVAVFACRDRSRNPAPSRDRNDRRARARAHRSRDLGFLPVPRRLEHGFPPEPAGTAPPWLANWGLESSLWSPVLYTLIGSFVLWALISRTTFFRNVRLMGADARTAFVSGVRLVPTRIGAHVIAGVFVGLASIMYTGLLGSADPTAGSSYTLSAVTALIISGASLTGGRAKGLGAILGAADIWLISYVLGTWNFGLNASYWIEVATGGVLVVALLVGSFLANEDLMRRVRTKMFPGRSR